MFQTHIDLWTSAADAFDKRHRQVTPTQCSLDTPCDEFDVEALIGHAVNTQVSIGGLLGAATTDGAQWEPTRMAVTALLSNDGALEGEVEHPGLGLTSKARLLEIATHDLVVHTWDLSRALGVDETLPAANLQPAIDSILAFPDAVREAVFAAPIDVDDAAGKQAALLAMSGRQP